MLARGVGSRAAAKLIWRTAQHWYGLLQDHADKRPRESYGNFRPGHLEVSLRDRGPILDATARSTRPRNLEGAA
jgi:hypothetical protein